MSIIEDFENSRDDLQTLLIEVLGSLIDADEVGPLWSDLPLETPALESRLAIHDMADDSYTYVEIRMGTSVGRIVASRLMHVAEPTAEDLLDVIAELGNIIAGNVKVLLRHSCQLSLPTATSLDIPSPDLDHGVKVGATVLGHLVELSVRPVERDNLDSEISWPGKTNENLLEIER